MRPGAIEPDDRDLLLRTLRGEEAAARTLWDRHAGPMLAYAAARLRGSASGRHTKGTDDAARDVVQSVFCRLLELDRGRARRVMDLRAFLIAAVRNAVANQIRGEARAATRRAEIAAGLDDQGRSGAQDEAGRELARAMERLEEEDREIVLLRHAAGMTFEQIAEFLNRPKSTIAARHASAVQRLRAVLDGTDETASRTDGRPPRMNSGAGA